ncbi:MAG: helix-hairpin-helix domain-containing protein [Clostridiales bacterium]|nr:helix-hairpin-helix domain-containing protein [Roseburia sp.]MDD7635610.1 helix-hairpin-helix domain-containing protein [Clostridiales bacterium]MDY4112655.1 helix-hairpin-helix domain-containing protein [Roseburia sp.]
MKLRANMILFIASLGIFGTGCGAGDTVYLEQAMSGEAVYEQATELSEYVQISEMKSVVSEAVGESEERVTEAMEAESGTCYVYICGAVLTPGVYEVPQGSRIYEVVQMAGGLTEQASKSSVNQAEPVYDGQMIFLPTLEEAEAGISIDALSHAAGDTDALDGRENDTDSRVNINTATLSELMTLSGIGQTKAERILAYRDAHGSFSSAEEIMNVDGIKEGLYNRIKDNIRVK